jgi:hypothetical protein
MREGKMYSDLFPLKHTNNVVVDEEHVYRHGKDIATTESVTKILNRGRNFNGSYMKLAANFGSRIHELIHRLIGQDSIAAYTDDELELAMYIMNRFPSTLHLRNGTPAIFSWKDKLIGGTPDVLNTSCVIEIKTTNKSSKIHEKQLVWYMEMYGKPKGYLVYAGPTLPNIVHTKGTPEYKHLLHCIQQDLRLFYEEPVEAAPGFNSAELSNLLYEIDLLRENLKTLEARKSAVIDEILTDDSIAEQIAQGQKARLQGFCLQKVFIQRKEVDIPSLSADGLYSKYVTTKESSYVKLMREGND